MYKINEAVGIVLDAELRRLRKENFIEFLKKYREKEISLEKELTALKSSKRDAKKIDDRNYKQL